jgi:hypothetical protein
MEGGRKEGRRERDEERLGKGRREDGKGRRKRRREEGKGKEGREGGKEGREGEKGNTVIATVVRQRQLAWVQLGSGLQPQVATHPQSYPLPSQSHPTAYAELKSSMD